jgi:hypothetical protein
VVCWEATFKSVFVQQHHQPQNTAHNGGPQWLINWKRRWLCPVWFHDLRKFAAINRLIHPTNYYN